MSAQEYKGLGMTHKGYVRLKNEDAYLVDDQHGCYAVADGLGGHRGGEIASHLAVTTFQQQVVSCQKEDLVWRDTDLQKLMQSLNQVVLDYGFQQTEVKGLGTTFTGLIIAGNTAPWLLHVGDSRAYGFTKTQVCVQLTEDQTVAMELVSGGKLDLAQAENHPEWHILTSCLGMPYCRPAIQSLPVTEYTHFLLCTDGLTNLVSLVEIQEQLIKLGDQPELLCQRLIGKALVRGGVDNITVVIITINEKNL